MVGTFALPTLMDFRLASNGVYGKRMDLKQLRTFQAVAELGSLSKAADRLRAAQPALSRHIKLLEHELRVELFIRNGRGMQLTSAGQMLLDRTTGLVRQIEQVGDDIQSASGRPSGRVILGLVPTVSAVLSGRLARRIIRDLPDISLRIVESYGGHLVEWLHRGEMDLAITYGPADDLHLSVHSIGREDLAVVGPPGSGLAKKKQVELAWLVKQRLILPSLSHGLRALLEKAVARKKLTLHAMIEAEFLPRPDRADGRGAGLHLVAGLGDPRRTGGQASGDGGTRQSADCTRTHSGVAGRPPLIDRRQHDLGADPVRDRTVGEGSLWKIKLAGVPRRSSRGEGWGEGLSPQRDLSMDRTPSPGSHLRCDPTSPRRRGEVTKRPTAPTRRRSPPAASI